MVGYGPGCSRMFTCRNRPIQAYVRLTGPRLASSPPRSRPLSPTLSGSGDAGKERLWQNEAIVCPVSPHSVERPRSARVRTAFAS